MGKFQTMLQDSLEDLGEDCEEVARALEKKRIKGVIGDQASCVLAEYLKVAFMTDDVRVAGDQDVTANGVAMDGDSIAWLDDFITRFDDGEWPSLVRPGKKKAKK